MTPDRVREFLRAVGTQPTGGSEWITASCPLARFRHEGGRDENPSFAVRAHPAKEAIFNCFSCGNAGKLHYLVELLTMYGAGGPRYDFRTALEIAEEAVAEAESGEWTVPVPDYDGEERDAPGAGEPVAYPETALAAYMRAWQVDAAVEYLAGRRVGVRVAKEMRLLWCPHGRMVGFPIRGPGSVIPHLGVSITDSGPLWGLRFRYAEPGDRPAYKIVKWNGQHNPDVWYGEAWVNYDRTVLMVESVFDVAAVWPHYRNVIAPMSAGMSVAKVRRVMSRCVDVVTLFDEDAAGQQARQKIERFGAGIQLRHLHVPADCVSPDTGERPKDPGEMDHADLSALLVARLPGAK